LRKSHYDYATELFFGFVGGGLAVSVFERQHKLDASVAHVACLVINGPDLQPFERGNCIGSVPIALRRHGDLAQKIIGFSEQSKPIVNYFHKRCAWGLRNGSYVMSWDSQFAEPIVLPNNVVATTLRHVIAYVSELPDAERNSREWRNARKHMLRAADQVGSTWFARIAIIRALKRRMPRFRRRSWSPEELRLLDKLVVDGASPRTAAEALNRSKETVRTKARRVGCPFPRRDEVKRQRPPAQEEVELPQLAR